MDLSVVDLDTQRRRHDAYGKCKNCLFYRAVGIPNELLMNRATGAELTPATLARIAEYTTDVRIAILLKLLECFSAIVLGVALYGITRQQDH